MQYNFGNMILSKCDGAMVSVSDSVILVISSIYHTFTLHNVTHVYSAAVSTTQSLLSLSFAFALVVPLV